METLVLVFLWALQSWLNLWSVMGGIGQGGGRSLYVAPKRPSRPGHPCGWDVGRSGSPMVVARASNCARTYTSSGRGALAAGVTCRPSSRISISDTWTACLLGLSVCWSTFKGSAPIAADENCKWVGSGWHVQGSASCVRRPVVGSGKQDGGPIISHLQH